VNTLRQAAFIQIESEFITAGRSEVCQTVVQVKDERCRNQSAERDGRVAALKSPERIAADKKPRRHVVRGDAALAPGEREVAAQLAERAFSGQRHGGGLLRHGISVSYNRLNVNQSLTNQTLLIFDAGVVSDVRVCTLLRSSLHCANGINPKSVWLPVQKPLIERYSYTNYARATLGDIAAQYLVPVIDLAVQMRAEEGVLREQFSEVAYYTPGSPYPWRCHGCRT